MSKTYPVPQYDTKGYRIKARRKVARRLFKQAGYSTPEITQIFSMADWENMTGREVFDRYASPARQQQISPVTAAAIEKVFTPKQSRRATSQQQQARTQQFTRGSVNKTIDAQDEGGSIWPLVLIGLTILGAPIAVGINFAIQRNR